MARQIARRIAQVALLLALPLLVGCASLNAYRPEAELLHGRHATIENFGTARIHPAEVDQLLREVAALLAVTLDPAVPPVRIIVTTPDRIARMHGAGTVAGHPHAAGLYYPGANLVLVPYFDRALLGHELAHYLTEHYLKAPRAEWEPIAHTVERRLAFGPRVTLTPAGQ